MSVVSGVKERELRSSSPQKGTGLKTANSSNYNYSLHGNVTQSMTGDPYSNFVKHLEEDPNPNFLRYTLLVMEKTAMHQQAELFRTIRQHMEKKYNLPTVDVWAPPQKLSE